MTSDRRPAKGNPSSRQPAPRPSARRPAAEPSSKRPKATSGRARPEEDEGADEASMIKKVMFYGSGALVVLMIVLVIVKWNALTADNKPPPKPKAINHQDILDGVDKMAKDAAITFAKAIKQPNDDDKVKGIREAKEKLAAAQEKLEALSGRKEYQGEEFDATFEPMRNRMATEMKTYHEALKRYVR